MTLPAESKAALRSRLRAELKALAADARASASAGLCARVRNSSAWQNARAVLLFFPVPSEPDIAPLLADALAAGKLLALPRFDPAANAYEAVRVIDPVRELVIGPFQVHEPVAACPVVALNRLDLALVPGLGFDARGHRLGRGKGHYDRLLAGFTGMKIGVAFDFQIVTEVPREPHDIALDAVVTPTRWLQARSD
ncbi:MAG: 5-formyltetrahydrofolate cyclo-ligase [Limisphaerales bacterium]|nr:MAG: 5-formyltetrahydrofolate cyclo-ligase [Limisphaerales bacterium]KAG0509294.1 MAG: 5-formyltetrahydrofolate cyclo-ligase [Limisphaerales bacterium]TXT52168.1 MAG: 5-formyltetrahydrofolate cyclo-ligase [Limisphaerales bacterium]